MNFQKNSLFQSEGIPRKKKTGSPSVSSEKSASRLLIGSFIQALMANYCRAYFCFVFVLEELNSEKVGLQLSFNEGKNLMHVRVENIGILPHEDTCKVNMWLLTGKLIE